MAWERSGLQSRRLTVEMALLLACCRWPVDVDRVRAAAAERVDWPLFLKLARRHRVQGLVQHALHAAAVTPGGGIAATLAGEARQIATHNLRLAAESLRLVRRLQARDASVLIVKGTPLAALAYGTLAIKMAWDIDLLVLPDAVAIAAEELVEAGYACVVPGPDRDGLTAWHAYSKESVWRHSVSGLHVELHSALVDSPLVLPGLDARGPGRAVTISPGIVLPTLAEDALLAYLCVHGTASGWRRAKWLADVAALIATRPPDEIRRLFEHAQALGAGRAAGQALLLCDAFLGVAVPPDLIATLRRDRWLRLMTWSAARMMTAPDGYDDPAETAAGTLPIHLMQTLILPGWRFTVTELRRKLAPDPRLGRLGRVRRATYPVAALTHRLLRRPMAGG